MAIRLLLTNNNTDPVNINVYRSDTAIDRDNLPAALVQLTQATGNPIVFTDPTAVQDNFYHYVFEVVGAKDRQLSRDFYLQATETRGEGKSKILVGDANLGYMDTILADNLIGSPDLYTALGLVNGSQFPYTYWYKFIRNNKILFVPSQPLVYNITGTQAKAAGTLDGSKVLTLRGNKYKVRLPKAWNEDGSNLPAVNYTGDFENMLTQTNEFNDLIYPMIDVTPLGQRLPNLAQMTYSQLRLNSYPNIIGNELSSDGTQMVVRGASATTRQAMTTVKTVALNAASMLWPILELVEG